jgi:putative transposase
MIDPKHEVSISRQTQLLGISRAAVYYVPRPVSEADLALMRRIDELHLDYPFAGARTLRDLLKPEGIHAGRKHIGTLMARWGSRRWSEGNRPAVARRATRFTRTCLGTS